MGDLPLVTKILVNGGIAAIVLIFVTDLIKKITGLAKVLRPATIPSGGNGGKDPRMIRQEIETMTIHMRNTEIVLKNTEESLRRAEEMKLCLQNLGGKLDTTNGLLKELVELQREKPGG